MTEQLCPCDPADYEGNLMIGTKEGRHNWFMNKVIPVCKWHKGGFVNWCSDCKKSLLISIVNDRGYYNE